MQTTIDIHQVREIVASFVGEGPSALQEDTDIGRTAVRSSVLLHRMYARLAEAGLKVPAGRRPRTFGELIAMTYEAAPAPSAGPRAPAPSAGTAAAVAVGIDMEDVANLPAAADYRTDPFYTQNFSPAEIAYCVLQADPRRSFAGRFCAKEAVVKADNGYRDVPFNRLEIETDSAGRPGFGDFALSISHTDDKVVAVAVRITPPTGIVRT